MTSPFKDCRTFLHMDYRLDDPNYVPAKDESSGHANSNKEIIFSFGNNCSSTAFPKYKIVNVKILCDRIFCRVSAWYNNSDLSKMNYTRTFDMTNNNDVLLYWKLCEEERAKRLMEDFKKENENK